MDYSATCDRPSSSSEPYLEVRPFKRQDIAAIADTVIASFHGNEHWWSPFWNGILNLGVREDLNSQLRLSARDRTCLVAVETTPATGATVVVGSVELSLRRDWMRSPSISAYIANLAVKPDHRRQGVARRLLLASERYAREWATSCLSLHVMEDNHPARKLYEGYGYRFLRSEPDWSTVWGSPRRLFLCKFL